MHQKFLDILAQTPQMLVTPKRLQDLDPKQWIKDEQEGRIRKPDGSFFYIGGVAVETKQGLEVSAKIGGWEQPLIYKDGGNVKLGIYDNKFLVRPKQEPGNPLINNRALWSAAFQASLSNEEQAHKGDKPLYSSAEGKIIAEVKQPKDGNRFYEKTNGLSILEMDQKPDLLGGAMLVTEKQLAGMISTGIANEHLVEAFALLKAKEVLDF